MKPTTPQSLRERLFAENDGSEVDRLVKRLIKQSTEHREAVIETFMEYAQSGPVQHWRAFVISLGILPLIKAGETRYRGFFEQCLRDPSTAYWSVDGLIKTAGRDSYPTLTAFALNPSNGTEDRANAIKSLAIHGGQTFIKGLPSNPGYWPEEDLPLQQLEEWSKTGYAQGRGFTTPARHPDLDRPISELDHLAQALDTKLAKARAKDQDLANPTNWLVPAAPENLAMIESRWRLPVLYLEFLRKFSPLKVTVTGRGFGIGLELYGAGDLVRGQEGYSFNPVEHRVIADWPASYVVIASMGADPFVLDLAAMERGDAPVLSASHGEGTWEFREVSGSFLTFLRRLAR